jgi:UDPglucose 6-dehydrogenase
MCNIVYKMKIGIIGNGFVGRATQIFAKNYDALDEFNPIPVYIYDIRPEACDPPGITLEELDRECDILFFCLPTPLQHDGSCYTRILEETIAKCPTNPYKVIRSTVPVGFAAKHGCYFMPEFLTEANWEHDFRRTKEWVVGIPATTATALTDEFKTRIQTLITTSYDNRAIDSPTVVFCDTNEAEMLKLMKNCFLSAKVSLMNEFYDFCAATGTDYNTVADLAKRDARMGTSHFQVPGPDGRRGFGGTCFPKDTHSLYCQMNAHGITPHIYPAILARNDTVDRPEREWSRDVWRTTIPLPTPASKVVVVFSDASAYITDVIRDNLAKNNVVIQVVRAYDIGNGCCGVSQTIHKNHLVKHRTNPNTPLFFPRVDECYYTQHTGDILYDIMREVSNVIDLWDSHEEMKLYVVKQSRYCDEHESESGTEGFDSDADADRNDDADAYTKSRLYDDYATTIIEEYFTKVVSVIPKNKRGLIVLF